MFFQKLSMPLSKRLRFVGPGAYNLKKLQEQTGETFLIPMVIYPHVFPIVSDSYVGLF